jgi:hypothetical protein
MNTPPSKSEPWADRDKWRKERNATITKTPFLLSLLYDLDLLPEQVIPGSTAENQLDSVCGHFATLQKEVESLRGELKMVRVGFDETKMEVKRLLDERTDLTQWFEHRHVYGTFTLEQRDAMTPRQMADYCYERKAEQLEVAHKALKKAKGCIEWCDCECSEMVKMKETALDAIKECGL